MICCLGISTSNSDINVVALHKTVKELYEQGRVDEREAQVCCGNYDKCIKACTPRGRWLANQQTTRFEQEKGQFVGGIPEVSQQREWVGLTNLDIHVLKMNYDKVRVVYTDHAKDLSVLGQDVDVDGLISAIQNKLNEKNHGNF
jgi:hypothetical protein